MADTLMKSKKHLVGYQIYDLRSIILPRFWWLASDCARAKLAKSRPRFSYSIHAHRFWRRRVGSEYVFRRHYRRNVERTVAWFGCKDGGRPSRAADGRPAVDTASLGQRIAPRRRWRMSTLNITVKAWSTGRRGDSCLAIRDVQETQNTALWWVSDAVLLVMTRSAL